MSGDGANGETRPAAASGASSAEELDGQAIAPDELRGQLQRILASSAFEASERRKRFLHHVVEELLAGRADRLKAYSIATAVFDRDDSFDPQTDPVVRLEARRLRRALEHYYLTAGHHDPIRIEIPKGGYAPRCERQAAALPASAGVAGPQAAAPLAALRGKAPVTGFAVALGVMLAVAALVWLWRAPAPENQGAAQAAADPQLEEPAVVVLPFLDLGGDVADQGFAAGLTEELISNLTRFEDLGVYAAHDEHGLADRTAPGAAAGVRYLVKGTVRRTDDAMRLTVHLIDLGSGRYLWSESFDRAPGRASPVALQKVLGAELATRLAEPHGVVREVTAGLLGQEPAAILRTYDCVSQAYRYRRTFSSELYRSSRACLEEAVEREPSRPDAWALLAFADLDEYRWHGFGPRYRQSAMLEQALAAAQRATELDRDSYLALSAYSAVLFYRGKIGEAEAMQRRALDLNPNNPELMAQLGWRIAFTRDWDQGIAMVRQAIERSGATDGWYFVLLAMDDYRGGDCRATLDDLERMGGPFFFIGPALSAMCQAELGNPDAARRALQESAARDPAFAEDPRGAFRLHRVPESLIERFMDGLRKAGLDDPAA